MRSQVILTAAATFSLAQAEDVLGVYIFHRHGDRTAKKFEPVRLTALGADQVYSSGSFYRSRYVDSEAERRIQGLSSENVATNQLDVTSPIDSVLHNSATVFLQGLYPPTGDSETLANGTRVEAPLGGYQYIPVHAVDDAASADKAESNSWLQGTSGCSNAVISSNNYFASKDYLDLVDETGNFYKGLQPVVKDIFSKDDLNYKNAYSVFDVINVATIHNSSIPSDDLLTKSTLDRLYGLASTHEWNLAYNSSDEIRAVAGSVLAGQVVDGLEAIIEKKPSATKFNAQFGAYGTFMAFFGLADMPKFSEDFYGITDYASSMAFELVTNASNPKAEDVSVRFYFSNGTAAENEPKLFPLFGQKETTLSWEDFKDGMMKFGVRDTKHWCNMCGNNEGVCASSGSSGDDGEATAESDSDSGSHGGISKAVAGVIGALVTLAVILGLQAAILVFGGLRLVKKSTLIKAASEPTSEKKV